MAGLGTRPPTGRLHVITDHRGGHQALAAAALAGGADVIQYRDKRVVGTRDRLAVAGDLRSLTQRHDAQLVINDRADIAVVCSADAVHLGRDDLPLGAARALVGGGVQVGATANSLTEALDVRRQPIDYLGVGPVFGTVNKDDPAPALGLADLATICAAVAPVPVIAIGGITAERVRAVLAAGAHGIAVLGAVRDADDPEEATRHLHREIEWALRSGP